MNHPTDQVEELYLLSQQAIGCSDYEQAAVFLKRAIELAPLRKDLRAELARVLAYREAEEPRYSPERDELRGDDYHSGSVQAPTRARSALRPLPSTALATMMRGPIESAEMRASTEHVSQMRPRVSVRTEGNVNLQLEDEPVSFSEVSSRMEYPEEGRRTALHTLLEDDEEDLVEPMPRPAPRRRRRSKLIQQRATIEDFIAAGFERSVQSIKQASPARFAYVSCYVVLAAFVGAACIQSRRVFGEQHAQAKVAKAQPRAAAPVQQASLDVLSLGSSGFVPPTPGKTEEDTLQEGRDLVGAKKYDAAISCLYSAAQSDSRTATHQLIAETLAQAYDQKATAKLQDGQFSAAVELYRKAMSVAPDSNVYRLHLSNALYYSAIDSPKAETEKLQESSRIAAEVVRREPQNTNGYQALAQAQEALGKKPEAKTSWNRVQSLAGKGSAAAKRAAERLQQLKGA